MDLCYNFPAMSKDPVSTISPMRIPRLLVHTMRDRKTAILESFLEAIRASEFTDSYRAFLTDTQEGKRRIGIVYELLVKGIQGNLQPLIDDQLRTGYIRARKQVPLDNTLQFHRILERIIIDEFLTLHADFELNPKDLYAETRVLGFVIDKSKEMISRSYIKTKEEIIEKRSKQIENLYNLRIAMDGSMSIPEFSQMMTREVSEILGASYVVVTIYSRGKKTKKPHYQAGNSAVALRTFQESRIHETQRDIIGVQVPHLIDPERQTTCRISPADIEVFPHHRWLMIPIFTKQNFYGFLSINNAESDSRIGTDAYVVLSVVSKIAKALERNQTLRILRKSKMELRRLTSRIIDVQEEHRQMISAEIHDTIIQKLTCIWLKLQFLQTRYPRRVKEFHEEFDFLKSYTDRSIQEARRIVSGLRPPALDELGIQKAIEGYVNVFREQNPIRVDLSFEGDFSALSSEKQINVFRIIQEALENARKHSNASGVWVVLRCVNGKCFFSVEDSGNGRSVLEPGRRTSPQGNFGLKIMKERADAMGGVLMYGRSKKGGGYSVRGNVPVG